MFKKELPIITMGLSIVAAALVLSWAVFIKPTPVAPVQAPVVDEDNEIVLDDDVLKIDTSDWKTHRNEEFGFEMRYPEDWDIFIEEYESRWHETVLGRVVVSGSIKDPFYAPLSITIRSNEERMSIKEWFQKNYPKDDSSKLQRVEFNETNGMRFSKRSNSVGSFYFSNEDKIYSISALDSQENIENQMKMTNQILSTFRFTE